MSHSDDSTNYRERLFLEADARRKECLKWLEKFMQPGQPRTLTKKELFDMARSDLNITRSNFDAAWILLIEKHGRQDWYDPIPRRAEKQKPRH